MTVAWSAEAAEAQAARVVVETYFRALHEGDLPAMQALFLKGAIISGYYEDECLVQELPQHLSFLKRLPTPMLLGEDLDLNLSSLEVVGQIAHVRAHYLFEALRFTDFLSLLKVGGDWRIVSKTFQHD